MNQKQKEVLSMKTVKAIAVVMILMFATTSVFAKTATRASRLSNGMVEKSIIEGETTQTEVLRMFGGPDITTISKDGEEVWTYSRKSNVSTTHGGQDTKKILLGSMTGAGLGAVVGHQSKSTGKGALLGGLLGAVAGGLFGYENPEYESGSRKTTLMVWFDESSIVENYTITTTQF